MRRGAVHLGLSIGAGSAYANDRLAPAAAMADSGRVTYIGFDSLAERTMALAHQRRRQDPATGQDERIRELIPLLAGYLGRGHRVIGNFGAANPDAAVADIVDSLRAQEQRGIPIGVIHGDAVLDLVRSLDCDLPERQTTVAALGDRVVSANAYIGAEPIVACLQDGAQIVVGGRIADPSLFVGPICHELGWALDDWDAVAHATMVGHLLECGVHSTGGNFEDPPYRVVPDPHRLGFPLADVTRSDAIITKLPGTGGAVDARTMKTQLYYEIHDPAAYLTPDVTADFSAIEVEDLGGDRVRLRGARGLARPANLKVLVGVDDGFRATGEISFGGPGCVSRARRAEEILRAHLQPYAASLTDVRIDLVGLTSLFGDRPTSGEPTEVRLRMAVHTPARGVADAAAHEVELLYFGPSGGGGVVTSVVPALGVTPAFVPRELVTLTTEVVHS